MWWTKTIFTDGAYSGGPRRIDSSAPQPARVMIAGRVGVAGCAASEGATGGLVMNARCRSVTAPPRRAAQLDHRRVVRPRRRLVHERRPRRPRAALRRRAPPAGRRPFQLAPTSWNVRGASDRRRQPRRRPVDRRDPHRRSPSRTRRTRAEGETSPSAAVASIAAQMRRVIRRIGEPEDRVTIACGPQPRRFPCSGWMTPNLRHNPLNGAPVLIVPGRASRPGATGRTTRVGEARSCPFCEGHERETPPEVDVDAAEGTRARHAGLEGARRPQQVSGDSRPRGGDPRPGASDRARRRLAAAGRGGRRACGAAAARCIAATATPTCWPG